MSDTHWTDELVRLRACKEAIAWARQYPTLRAAWDACDRGHWMSWYLDRVRGRPGSVLDRRAALVWRAVMTWAAEGKMVKSGADAIRAAVPCPDEAELRHRAPARCI